MTMTNRDDRPLELYSIRDCARVFGLAESRLRYWIQTGFLRPSVRQRGRFYYTFADLIAIKAAVELMDAGIATEPIRKALIALRRQLPAEIGPGARLRVCSDGESLALIDEDGPGYRGDGQLVMAFPVASLVGQLEDKLPPAGEDATPQTIDSSVTEPHTMPSAYQAFLDGCKAEDTCKWTVAEMCYRQALELEPSLAAAHTNLGNLLHRRGDIDQARACYKRALELEPDQAEARFNLANLLDECGDTEMAVAELRHLCSRNPEFADAHYNLGLMLWRLGGVAQARNHLGRYLEHDAASEWAERARSLCTTDSLS